MSHNFNNNTDMEHYQQIGISVQSSKKKSNEKMDLRFLSKTIRYLSIIAFLAIFGYWSLMAIEKYLARPISSSISYTYGDDGFGHIGNKKT